MSKHKIRMRALNVEDIEVTKKQMDEVVQLLKTENLTELKPDEYYVMKGYHLISMYETLMGMKRELDKAGIGY